MLLIFTRSTSQRLSYILETLMPVLGVVQWEITTDRLYFINAHANAYLNYSDSPVRQNEIRVAPHNLLFELTIHHQRIQVKEWCGLKCFFSTPGDIPFDLFAASFYLISRYEEYLSHVPDKHHRFSHTTSLAYREKFIQLPLVNLWLEAFKNVFNARFPDFDFHQHKFKFIPTYDVDIAYQYKGQMLKNVLIFLKNLVGCKTAELKVQLKVLLKQDRDPFDVFEWIETLHKKFRLEGVFFFLSGKSSSLDKNIPLKKLRPLVRQLKKNNRVELHPSGNSSVYERQLLIEKLKLERITETQITASRQHYLKLKTPHTYRALAALGIEDEYSMGYGSVNGFRASFCNSFLWFDLRRNAISTITLHPFCFMDSTSIFSLKQTPQQAEEELEKFFSIISAVNGTMVTVLHNHLLTEVKHGQRRAVYENMLRKISEFFSGCNSQEKHHTALQDSR